MFNHTRINTSKNAPLSSASLSLSHYPFSALKSKPLLWNALSGFLSYLDCIFEALVALVATMRTDALILIRFLSYQPTCCVTAYLAPYLARPFITDQTLSSVVFPFYMPLSCCTSISVCHTTFELDTMFNGTLLLSGWPGHTLRVVHSIKLSCIHDIFTSKLYPRRFCSLALSSLSLPRGFLRPLGIYVDEIFLLDWSFQLSPYHLKF